MRRKALSLGLAAVLLLCGCGQKSETAAATPAQAVTASAAQSSTARPVSTGVTPEQFGAKGDGIADDLQALQAAMQQASASGQPLELTAGAVYRFSSSLGLPSGLTIQGNGAVLLSDIQYPDLREDRVAVELMKDSDDDRAHDVRLENVTFRAADSCQANYMLRVMLARNVEFVGCTFDCEPNEWGRCAADLYGGNENIRFEGCVFRQMTSGASGGIWVRNWTDRVESRNIRFQNCEFYKSGADELLAVWGWGGAVRDVVLSGCSFYETQTQEALDADHRPVWFITLGQSGTTDVRMEDCTVRAEYCETIFRMVGDKTRAVVDNCDITMKQPDSMAKHDMKKGANPMLARGNDRADGSTVIQNSRITLSGDNGRRICYQLSALKGNTLDVSLGYGIASTKEVSGNTIRGRIRHKVFQDCSGVENNNVEVRRFSILG